MKTPGWVGVCAMLGWGLLLVTGVAGAADNAQLMVTQDESAMEKVIASYLKEEYKLILEEERLDEGADDLRLKVPFRAEEGVPKFDFYIDTQPTNYDEADRVTERGVLLNLETGVIIPEGKRAQVAQLLNDHNRRKNFSSVYMDLRGQIQCDWILNVMSPGLATDYVYDVLVRIQGLWRGLWPEIAAALDEEIEAGDDGAVG